MFESILIATDGSRHAENAAKAGIEIARLSKSKVTAIYVADIGKEYSAAGEFSFNIADEVISELKSSLLKQGAEATGRIKAMANDAGVPFESKVIEGHPADDILKFAAENKANLIVMGSIGARGLARFLLGSVTEKVVRNSKVPVLVVHGE